MTRASIFYVPIMTMLFLASFAFSDGVLVDSPDTFSRFDGDSKISQDVAASSVSYVSYWTDEELCDLSVCNKLSEYDAEMVADGISNQALKSQEGSLINVTDQSEQAIGITILSTSCLITEQFLSHYDISVADTWEYELSESRIEHDTGQIRVGPDTRGELVTDLHVPAIQSEAEERAILMGYYGLCSAEHRLPLTTYSCSVGITVPMAGDYAYLVDREMPTLYGFMVGVSGVSDVFQHLFVNLDIEFSLPAEEGLEELDNDTPVKNRAFDRPLPVSIIVVGETAGAGAAAGLASHLSNLLRWFWLHLFAPLFSRLRKEEILDNPVRERIYNEIRESSGIHYRELLRRLGISNGTLAFHLYRLEQAGYVRSHRVRGRRHISVTDTEIDPTAFLATERQRQIFNLVRRHSDGASPKDIESFFFLSRSDISYNLGVLRSLGLVEVRRDQTGRARYYACER